MEIRKLESGYQMITLEDGSFIIVENVVATSEDLGVTLTGEPVDPKEEVKSEAKEEAPKKEEEAPKKEEEDPDEWTCEDLEGMDREELEEVIDDEELELDPDDFKSTKKLRKAIAEELELDDC